MANGFDRRMHPDVRIYVHRSSRRDRTRIYDVEFMMIMAMGANAAARTHIFDNILQCLV